MRYQHFPLPEERLEPIAEMAHGIASARTLHEVFRSLFLFAGRTTPADGIFVALYAPQTELRRCVYAANLLDGGDGRQYVEEDVDLTIYPQVPLNTGPQSRAIVTGEVVTTPDLDAAVTGLARVNSGSNYEERPPRSSVAVPFDVEGTVLGAFEVQSTELAAFGVEHVAGLKMAARLAAIAVRNLDLLDRERAQHEATLRALGLALEYRDFETKGHTDRVVNLSMAFGAATGLDEEALHALRWGAYLHDLGKVAVPDEVLLKPGRLTDEEFETVRRHTLIGVDMCADIPFLSEQTRAVVRSHHERWDGTGYPDRLEGRSIPLLARMFSLVDVYDALTSERPYKQAWTHEAALAEMRRQAGRQFDPDLVEVFAAVVKKSDGTSVVGGR